MKIVFASFIANSRETGMGNWTHRITESLLEAGHNVRLLFAEDFPNLVRMGAWGRNVYPLLLAARLFRWRGHFDVAVIHEPSGFWYGMLRRLGLVPAFVAVSHGVESRIFSEMEVATASGFAGVSRGARWKAALLRRWQADGALRAADQILCLAEADRVYLVKVLGVDSARITRVTNGVDSRPDISNRLGRTVLILGSWIPEKGSRIAPKIWERVIGEVPEAQLRVIGTGFREEEVLRTFSMMGKEQVRVVSWFREEALTELARGASVFLLPSMREGSPLALLEAMAMGLAPVAARVGGIPEILSGELEALMYERFDVARAAELVIGLLRDPARAAAIGQLARARAKELTWGRTAKLVESACTLALEHRSRHILEH